MAALTATANRVAVAANTELTDGTSLEDNRTAPALVVAKVPAVVAPTVVLSMASAVLVDLAVLVVSIRT